MRIKLSPTNPALTTVKQLLPHTGLHQQNLCHKLQTLWGSLWIFLPSPLLGLSGSSPSEIFTLWYLSPMCRCTYKRSSGCKNLSLDYLNIILDFTMSWNSIVRNYWNLIISSNLVRKISWIWNRALCEIKQQSWIRKSYNEQK